MSGSSRVRMPAVAGRFYPDNPVLLREEVRKHLGDVSTASSALALMAPHAGYVYSGRTAGKTFARVAVPRRVIVLAPNHTGRGAPLSLIAGGSFRIPGADVPIDEELAQTMLAGIPGACVDPRAHEWEHAIEVELPFLLARQPEIRIVPLVIAGLSEEASLMVGESLAGIVGAIPEPDDVLVVASSDMSHYLPDEQTRRLDRLAIDRILDVDAPGLFRTVTDQRISMCGYVPATIMLSYVRARSRGAATAELADYTTSGDAFGDYSKVVGYAGMLAK
ncbi:MAG: AmmeMemoRadiSam system protein B [Pseudomonadota bacterium]